MLVDANRLRERRGAGFLRLAAGQQDAHDRKQAEKTSEWQRASHSITSAAGLVERGVVEYRSPRPNLRTVEAGRCRWFSASRVRSGDSWPARWECARPTVVDRPSHSY